MTPHPDFPQPVIFPVPFDMLDLVLQRRAIDRLVWQYGEERAAKILAGLDPHTNLDIAKWNALGVPKNRREGVEL